MIRRPPRSTQSRSSAASDVYKRQGLFFQTFNTIRHRTEKTTGLGIISRLAATCGEEPEKCIAAFFLAIRRRVRSTTRFFGELNFLVRPFRSQARGLNCGAITFPSANGSQR
eukprot:TRINITY_DN11484_c0_g1_i1.p1 TRINITY_DN11484_c0_g1~~TRINITY_DN11484_c0_g1_i1.p1  ORF type:complete len:112 (+),score=28.48 TRINITY_DN11484_c0_g1_i1:133-468(+)